MTKLEEVKGIVNIVKDNDYGTASLLFLTGIEWYLNEIKYTVMSGCAALLYRVIFKTTENQRKSMKYYKKWRVQILARKNDNGHEIRVDFDAFSRYFPLGTEEQYYTVISMLEADADLGIKRDNPQFRDEPYYIGQ